MHGIGLKNVKYVVEKYHGALEISFDEREFRIVIT
ncbi:MAG: GHKL domain-containing protein [Lachnospiraceae bacterium]|nr:GHKL domain-containing protein [Lachnospiraceae bacterium]